MFLLEDDTLALGDQVDSLDLLVTRLAEHRDPPHLLRVLGDEISIRECDVIMVIIKSIYPTVPFLIFTPCGARAITGLPSSSPVSIAITKSFN